jgi:hypothetical protein
MSWSRRDVLHAAAAAAMGSLVTGRRAPGAAAGQGVVLSGRRLDRPLAITMWDFSWLERRWPGAGYEDWDEALGELTARGYDAVRIDAYPHLIAAGAERTWELLPCWNQQDWGSPALNRVRVQPELNQFIAACERHGLLVGLSTWFREDRDNTRMTITSPEALGRVWDATLDSIPEATRRRLLYVDLCNEWPLDVWAPFYPKGTPRRSPEGVRWMRDAIAVVRASYPGLSYTFSFTSEYDSWREQDVSMLDFLEPHLWMTHFTDFYQQVGYHYERFESKGYENLVQHAERLYRERPDHWQAGLKKGIALLADWSRAARKPLVTTECWSLVDYKDWPLLSWDWLKELCEFGVREASATGRWAAIATSNFCGPQFRGMWRDVAWHRRMTDVIHRGALPAPPA